MATSTTTTTTKMSSITKPSKVKILVYTLKAVLCCVFYLTRRRKVVEIDRVVFSSLDFKLPAALSKLLALEDLARGSESERSRAPSSSALVSIA